MCTPSSTPQSASAPYRCCPLLSHFEYTDRRTCTGISPSKLPLCMGDLDRHLTHCSLVPPGSISQTTSRSVQPLSHGSWSWPTDRPTDHATVASGTTLYLWPHLATESLQVRKNKIPWLFQTTLNYLQAFRGAFYNQFKKMIFRIWLTFTGQGH